MNIITRQFLEAMEKSKLGYELLNEDKNGSDYVAVPSGGMEADKDFKVIMSFSAKPDKVQMLVFGVCKVPDDKVGNVLIELNRLNCGAGFTRFYLETDGNNTVRVDAESDHLLGERYCAPKADGSYSHLNGGEIAGILCFNFVKSVDEAYSGIMRAIWSD